MDLAPNRQEVKLTQTHSLTQLGIMARDERLERYRLNAEKCLELAQRFKQPDAKRTMVAMSRAWLILAEQHSKKRKTETLTTATEPPMTK